MTEPKPINPREEIPGDFFCKKVFSFNFRFRKLGYHTDKGNRKIPILPCGKRLKAL